MLKQGAQLNDVDDLATDPASACYLLLPVPTFAQVHEAIKQANPDLKDIAPRHIDIYLQEARSPRLLFCWLRP